jgi:hypothetical protein
MLRTCLLLSVSALLVDPVTALELKSCEEANVGLTTLIAPVAKHSRTFKDDKISLFAVDTVEPVCCAAGVAVVIPDVADELGGNKCLAVVGVASVQLDEAVSQDDPAKGVLISIPTRVFNEASDSAPGEPIKLRIDVDTGTIIVE